MPIDSVNNSPQMARLQPNSPNDLKTTPEPQQEVEGPERNPAEERNERERVQKQERAEATPPPKEEGRGSAIDVYA